MREEVIEDDLSSDVTSEKRTEREMKEAMNSVSEDLMFTTETEDDFNNKRLPTLSFQVWSEKSGLRHSYFEKDMRAQILTMKKSSQSEQSKYSILVNELTRRFEVVDKDIDVEERVSIVDHYTQQLVNSGYGEEQIRDIVESSLKGIVRKEERRVKRKYQYRCAEETLEERNRRKLTENVTWFREENEEEEDEQKQKRKEAEGAWSQWRKVNKKRKRIQNSIEIDGKKKIMSVLFVQHTERSALAKKLREKLETLEKVGNIKIKVVEKTGDKPTDLLHKSDSWEERKCERKDCMVCENAGEDDKLGQCKKRSVIYETFCLTCEETEKKKKAKKIEEKETEQVMKNKKKRKIEDVQKEENKQNEKKKEERNVIAKYIGETGRSAYERGVEHWRDFENCDENSHMMKHYLLRHKDLRKEDVKFAMRVRKKFRSALERQVGEAITIDRVRRSGQELLNSKSEYNRCSLPRISTKSHRDAVQEEEEENEEEKRI